MLDRWRVRDDAERELERPGLATDLAGTVVAVAPGVGGGHRGSTGEAEPGDGEDEQDRHGRARRRHRCFPGRPAHCRPLRSPYQIEASSQPSPARRQANGGALRPPAEDPPPLRGRLASFVATAAIARSRARSACAARAASPGRPASGGRARPTPSTASDATLPDCPLTEALFQAPGSPPTGEEARPPRGASGTGARHGDGSPRRRARHQPARPHGARSRHPAPRLIPRGGGRRAPGARRPPLKAAGPHGRRGSRGPRPRRAGLRRAAPGTRRAAPADGARPPGGWR